MNKEPLSTDSWKKVPSKQKDLKTFCKGKPGKYHQLEFVESKWNVRRLPCQPSTGGWKGWSGGSDDQWTCFHTLRCGNCKKVFWDRDFRCPDRPEDS